MQLFTFPSNNCDAATEYIEEKFISRQLTEDANLSFVFRKLLEDKEETALEKCKCGKKVHLQKTSENL